MKAKRPASLGAGRLRCRPRLSLDVASATRRRLSLAGRLARRPPGCAGPGGKSQPLRRAWLSPGARSLPGQALPPPDHHEIYGLGLAHAAEPGRRPRCFRMSLSQVITNRGVWNGRALPSGRYSHRGRTLPGRENWGPEQSAGRQNQAPPAKGAFAGLWQEARASGRPRYFRGEFIPEAAHHQPAARGQQPGKIR